MFNIRRVAAFEAVGFQPLRANHFKAWLGVCEPDDFRYSCMRSGRKHLAKPVQESQRSRKHLAQPVQKCIPNREDLAKPAQDQAYVPLQAMTITEHLAKHFTTHKHPITAQWLP